MSKTRRFLTAVLLLVVSSGVRAAANGWTSGGPVSLPNATLAMAPSDPGVLYLAAGESGLYRTADGGDTWTRIQTPDGQIVGSMAVHPTSPMTVYAIAQGQLFRSDDGGTTWAVTLSDETRVDIVGLTVDPAHPGTIYASSEATVYRSASDGRDWTPIGTIPSSGPRSVLWRIFFMSDHPTTLFASIFADPMGDVGAPLRRSDDGGVTWNVVGHFGHDDGSVGSLAGSSQSLYASTIVGLFRSQDGGNTWTQLTAAPAVDESSPIAVDPHDPSHVLVGDRESGIGESHDGGATWTRRDTGLPRARAASLAFGAPLYAGTAEGVFQSSDGGASWQSMSHGLIGSHVQTVAAAPRDPVLVYAGTDHGLSATHDGGANWSLQGLFNNPVQCIVVDPHAPQNLYASSAFGPASDLYKSTDGGRTWASAHTGMEAWGYVTALAADPSHPTTLYVSEAITDDLYESTDAAATWHRIVSDLNLTSIVVDPSDSSVLYGTKNPYESDDTVVKSTDGGRTWATSGSGLPAYVSAISIDPANSSVLYLPTAGGVFKSTDAAATWSLVGLAGQAVTSVVVEAGGLHAIYAATDGDGVYRSADGGATWEAFNDGLTDRRVTFLAIDAAGHSLHAGTAGSGVFDRTLSTPTEPCADNPGALCLLGRRFRVTLTASDPRRSRTTAGRAVPQGDRFGYFSFPEFTGDSALPEVVVKMLDVPRAPWNSVWVFYSGMTSLPYTLTVEDTASGEIRTYSGDGFCGKADTAAFASAGANPAVPVVAADELAASGKTLSLLSGRFDVTLVANNPHTHQDIDGTAIPQGDRFGYFSLPELTGDAAFPEVFVKMLDATSLDGAFWFFHTSLTKAPYLLIVTDTLKGDVRRVYNSVASGPTELCGAADTAAFRQVPPTGNIGGSWSGMVHESGATDEDFCPGSPEHVSPFVTQLDSTVSFRLPAGGSCSNAGELTFVGSLQGDRLTGRLQRRAAPDCLLEGHAAGTAGPSSIVLHGGYSGPCNHIAIDIELAR